MGRLQCNNEELERLEAEHRNDIGQFPLSQIPVVAKAFKSHHTALNQESADACLTNDNILIQNIDVQDVFNPTSYLEFKRQRSKFAKDIEQKTLETESKKPDQNPFADFVDLGTIHNGKLMTPSFKECMLKHIVTYSTSDKLQFRCHRADNATLPGQSRPYIRTS
jgi:hypothetical protein